VRHRDQVQPAVEDAEDVVALEIELVDIALDLFVVGVVAETQVAVVLVEGQQVGRDPAACPGPSARIGTIPPAAPS
jgi:hypothetical protein